MAKRRKYANNKSNFYADSYVGEDILRKADQMTDENTKYIWSYRDAYIDIYNKTEEISALLMAHKLWESLSLRLIADFGNEDDVIRIKYKELQCAKMLDEVASGDCILRDMINKLYSGKRVLVWSLDFLETAPQKTYERMRNSLEFNRMLKKFR